ncbi:hypothetical protein LPJ59_003540 [Coemansia sp. RSA 2399]|nr:hypothetical protein LPJ59_003540 [Coemansia sp. RSA 2399]KAJ1900726.1 hypothetical protein LPJ81_003885 [Coemansia sp. IMI 209127]
MDEPGNQKTGSPPTGHQWIKNGLVSVSSIALCGSVLTIVVFFILLAFNSRRVNIPLVNITMAIQSVNSVALILSIVLLEVRITADVLCSSLRYILYICYLTSIFMACAVTVHLWLVITRRKLVLARRNERWYYIIPLSLAFSLSSALACIPSSAFGMANRCTEAVVPDHYYLLIRWCLYYGWFVIASVISFLCMFSVLRSARRLTHMTHTRGHSYQSSAEEYRNAVNARANSKRLRSLVFYTIAYPVISFVCNFPQLLQELLASTLKRPLVWLSFLSRVMLFSEGFFLSLTFFLYPAVIHSIRDLTHEAVRYWVIEQEEYWRMRKIEPGGTSQQQQQQRHPDHGVAEQLPSDKKDIRNFTSKHGRLYHFVLSLTPEGRRATSL